MIAFASARGSIVSSQANGGWITWPSNRTRTSNGHRNITSPVSEATVSTAHIGTRRIRPFNEPGRSLFGAARFCSVHRKLRALALGIPEGPRDKPRFGRGH